LPLVPFEEAARRYPPDDHQMFIAVSYAQMNRLRAERYAQARALGYREVRLDALNERIEALPLYYKLGFGPDPDPPDYARNEPGVISLRMPL
jgi:hypothetical protein